MSADTCQNSSSCALRCAFFYMCIKTKQLKFKKIFKSNLAGKNKEKICKQSSKQQKQEINPEDAKGMSRLFKNIIAVFHVLR